MKNDNTYLSKLLNRDRDTINNPISLLFYRFAGPPPAPYLNQLMGTLARQRRICCPYVIGLYFGWMSNLLNRAERIAIAIGALCSCSDCWDPGLRLCEEALFLSCS